MTLHRSSLTAAAAMVVLTAPALMAQEGTGRAQRRPEAIEDAAARLGVALHEAQRGHLWRVAAWGGFSLVTGLALVSASSSAGGPTRRGFGIQTAAWGAINVAIATWGLTSGAGDPPLGLGGALRAEDAYAHVLLVNLGLNVGYVAVGSALAVAGSRGIRSGPAVKGHGWGVLVQGLGLLILDGIAYAGSRGRLSDLHGLVDGVLPGPVPGSLSAVLWSLPLG